VEFLNSSSSPISVEEVKLYSSRDPTLSRIVSVVSHGWPNSMEQEKHKPYWRRKNELGTMDGCLLWGSRVVVPSGLRERILQELHQTHPGVVKMLARSYVWWPKMDEEIETTVRKCITCQLSRPLPSVAPLHPWEWPSRPWSRLHIDYANHYHGRMYLIITV
jgi:hypothetical protein